MKKFFANLFAGLLGRLESTEETSYESKLEEETEEKVITIDFKKPCEEQNKKTAEINSKKTKVGKSITTSKTIDIRDIMELMEIPIVSLSKNRTAPIIYESPDGRSKVRVSCHPPHYVASIYDWDIIMLVSSKLQELMNSGSDIPSKTLIIPRHELLKALKKHDGKKEEKDLKASLSRLKSTLIETTIRNEDGRYDAGFGFLDSWGYTDRKDVKEFRITLSQWLYDGTCKKGALLKCNTRYFYITSGLKKFLYRTARKHVGIQNNSWAFSVETLYLRSGSEQDLRGFKRDLKKAVTDNDLPDYSMKWTKENGKEKVYFMNKEELEKTHTIPSKLNKNQGSLALSLP